MRYKDRLDLGLIVAQDFYSGAAVFTTNICQAAPVLWSKDRYLGGRAILANAGQANAQTGKSGFEDATKCAQALGGLLRLEADKILLASTGVIGDRLNMEALESALPRLVESLREDAFEDFSKAILTTDTVPKVSQRTVELSGERASIWGCVKGSGMIAPTMATMLAFVLTDLKVEGNLLQKLLRDGTEQSFNRVTVDGDTSTNDSLFLISSGRVGKEEIRDESSTDAQSFQEALNEVLVELAKDIAKDGEGAQRFITVRVIGARDQKEALLAAKTVCESPLVKTAFYGKDANWGRVLAALGRSGAAFDQYSVDLDLDTVPWVRNGVDNGREEDAQKVMEKREYTLTIDLKNGEAKETFYTCDLTHDYISINSSYKS
jgi:glutamate N-acetyltransferase/amino-acid N-acetyltransferase